MLLLVAGAVGCGVNAGLANATPGGPGSNGLAEQDAAILAIDKFIADSRVDKAAAGWRTRLAQPPKVEFDATHDYFWHVETDLGSLKIKLHTDTAPMHVASAIYLVRLGYYDGLSFHRVIPGFMAQGGCPEGSGRGGPGYQFSGEFQGNRKHDKPGVLSMANAGPSTDGSQFFLTFVPAPHLDGRHTIWGEVVDGMPALKALEGKGTAGGVLADDEQIKIVRTSISVAEKPKGEAPKDEKKKKEPGK
ncbi:MAG: peptidylprolyl isomerase [Planctomycetota bacterium]